MFYASTRHRYKVSVYRTIDPLVDFNFCGRDMEWNSTFIFLFQHILEISHNSVMVACLLQSLANKKVYT